MILISFTYKNFREKFTKNYLILMKKNRIFKGKYLKFGMVKNYN